jgi:hypothetical protein
MTVTLITSAAYIGTELAAEYGHLPPTFLPVGHKRLFELQHQTLKGAAGTIYLTLPESFQVPEADRRHLEALSIAVVSVPDGLVLCESLLYALAVIGTASGPVRVLHGDTLIYDLRHDEMDVVAVGRQPEAYDWGHVDGTSGADQLAGPATVLAGYFCFSSAAELRRALARARGDFVRGVGMYRAAVGLRTWQVTDWLALGHLQTFYRSRCRVRTQRAFNELDISFRVVEKRSSQTAKMDAEAAWFASLPEQLRLFTPAYLGRRNEAGHAGYALEYLPIPSLHELFVFGELGRSVWSRIIEACFRFMSECLRADTNLLEPVMQQLTVAKTEERLAAFEQEVGIGAAEEWRYGGRQLPSLRQIARIAAEKIDAEDRSFLGVMHGDFCFTNTFYDFRTQQVRVIDPRGTIDGRTPTVFGDTRYDLAKLNHSLSGGYDFILANRFACEGFETRDMKLSFPPGSTATWLPAVAAEFDVQGMALRDPQIVALTIHLFLSMLPLHADRPDRQKAFVANALRLYSEGLDPA